MERVNTGFDKLSRANQSMGELEVILQRCRDGVPVWSAGARVRRRASADRLDPPLEPYWTFPSDSEPAENILDDNEEFLLYYAAFYKLSDRERAYLKMQRADGEYNPDSAPGLAARAPQRQSEASRCNTAR
jgi:hypothetical protein